MLKNIPLRGLATTANIVTPLFYSKNPFLGTKLTTDVIFDFYRQQGEPIKQTTETVRLTTILYGTADILRKDRFRMTRGVASNLLVATPPMDRSAALQAFVRHGPYLLSGYLYEQTPNTLFPVYISYKGAHLKKDQETFPLTSLVKSVLPVPLQEDSITSTVRENGIYMPIIVDHLEDLFRMKPSQGKAYDDAITTLWDLVQLGDQASGRFYTLICGSSTMLKSFVNCDAKRDENMRKNYPLLCDAPELDDTKYGAVYLGHPPFEHRE